MRNRISDYLIIAILVLLPLFGLTQACNTNGPVMPKPDGDNNPPENRAPTAIFSVVGPEEGPTPFTVKLDGSRSSDPDNDKLEYHWQFSDGGMAVESVAQHEFTSSGKHWVRLTVIDQHGLSDDSDPAYVFGWGLANSAWPKFAHDERNSGVSPNYGPVQDDRAAKAGHPFPRTWQGGIANEQVDGVCVGYDGMVVYTQGRWLRARTAQGVVMWDTQVESQIMSWPAIAYDGSIVFGTRSGWIHRVGSDGKIIWSTNVSSEVGYPLVFLSAANIGHDRQIYVGGYMDENPLPMVMTGGLVALSFDGKVLWSKNFRQQMYTTQYSSYPPDLAPVVPAILPNGNVVVNGLGGHLYAPDGTELAKLDYNWNVDTGVFHTAPLGPPAVSPDGLICFTNMAAPVFDSNGSFLTIMFPLNDYYYLDPGPIQTPAWSDTTLEMLSGYGQYTLYTHFNLGGASALSLGTKQIGSYSTTPPAHPYPRPAGAILDYSGRAYVSTYRLQMATPLRAYSSYPYWYRKYQWSYGEASHMTSPVIGDDRWLYVGMDNDLVALGD